MTTAKQIIGPGINPVGGANPFDAFLIALFENLTLLFYREGLPRLDSLNFISPEPIALITDSIFRADGFYAILFALFECRQLFSFTKARTTL
jgi:hypothetical protein